jgi:hypothetical protein
MKNILVLGIVFGLLLLAEGITNPTEYENIAVMAGLAVLGWTAIIYKVETK